MKLSGASVQVLTYAVTGGQQSGALDPEQASRALGLPADQVRAAVDELMRGGFVTAEGASVRVSVAGRDQPTVLPQRAVWGSPAASEAIRHAASLLEGLDDGNRETRRLQLSGALSGLLTSATAHAAAQLLTLPEAELRGSAGAHRRLLTASSEALLLLEDRRRTARHELADAEQGLVALKADALGLPFTWSTGPQGPPVVELAEGSRSAQSLAADPVVSPAIARAFEALALLKARLAAVEALMRRLTECQSALAAGLETAAQRPHQP